MCAAIDRLEVQRIAALAHLRLSDEEQERYARDLQDILTYAEQIRLVDTGDVPATFHVLAPSQADRADTVAPSLPRGEAVRNAPEPSADRSLFKAPRVIGG